MASLESAKEGEQNEKDKDYLYDGTKLGQSGNNESVDRKRNGCGTF